MCSNPVWPLGIVAGLRLTAAAAATGASWGGDGTARCCARTDFFIGTFVEECLARLLKHMTGPISRRTTMHH